jgi:hypothetical protein
LTGKKAINTVHFRHFGLKTTVDKGVAVLVMWLRPSPGETNSERKIDKLKPAHKWSPS